MFHIFYVNEGYMMVLEPSSLCLVLDLQKCIQEKAKLEVSDQVLFLANGELITSNSSLASYMGSGSEENPIYLVKRVTNFDREKFSSEQEGINVFYKNWQSGVDKLEKGEKMTNAVLMSEYAKLAKYGFHVSDMMFKFCGKIVTEHKHMQLGWAAVINNLDIHNLRLSKHIDRASKNGNNLCTMRQKGYELLNNFDSVFETLSKIIMPSQLLNSMPSNDSTFTSNFSDQSKTSESNITLYDWISAKDCHSLDDLIGYVRSDLEKADDVELVAAKTDYDAISKLVKKPEYREIRGIEKRLVTLNLRMQYVEEKHLMMRDLATHIMQFAHENGPNSLKNQRNRVSDFSQCLSETYQIAVSFINSKIELLKNVCQRLACWVKQAYECLYDANKQLVVFGEKYNGLCQRLILVRQLKEAPIMYITAVAEVIRREALQKEFFSWITLFVEKCEKFISEENKIRSEFYAKLEKHFLRQLFYGMSDEIPDFCPKITMFDKNMPCVPISHLRNLRKTFPELNELLNVTTPQVYSRLVISDPNAVISPQSTQQIQFESNLKREESFFIREQTMNIVTMNQNFPSTNWLSEDHMDMSPANNFFMTSKQGGFGASNSSLHSLTSPMELGPLSEFNEYSTSKSIKLPDNNLAISPISDPIDIPNSSNTQIKTSSSTIHQQLSETSSNFGTPDDQLGSFPEKNLFSFSQNLLEKKFQQKNSNVQRDLLESLEILPNQQFIITEILRTKCVNANKAILSIKQLLDDLKNSTETLQTELKEETLKNFNTLHSKFKNVVNNYKKTIKKMKKHNQLKLERNTKKLIKKFENEKKKLNTIVEYKRDLRKEKEKDCDKQKQLSEKLNSKYLAVIKTEDDMNVDLVKIEQEPSQLKQQLETNASVDFFLIEVKAVEHFLKRELTSEEIEQLKHGVEKRNIQNNQQILTKSLVCEPEPIVRSKVLNDYEKSFRCKMEFIVKGIEEKKNKEFQTLRQEIEAEFQHESELYIKKLKYRISELEKRVTFYETLDNNKKNYSEQKKEFIDSSMQVISDDLFMSDIKISESNADDKYESELVQSFANLTECDNIKSFKFEQPSVETKSNLINNFDTDQSVINSEQISKTSCFLRLEDSNCSICDKTTQTRLRSCDINYMISLKHIHEGSTVLITWNNVHKVYMVFCTSPVLHFVKENSIQKMGMDLTEGIRKNWLFVVVNRIDVCQIKKSDNRYNLPINTIFNHVKVSPLNYDSSIFSLSNLN